MPLRMVVQNLNQIKNRVKKVQLKMTVQNLNQINQRTKQVYYATTDDSTKSKLDRKQAKQVNTIMDDGGKS